MGQVIKRALSQTHVTWFSNRGGLGKGCDLSNLPNLQNIVCLQKVANPQMQSCLSLSDLLPRFPATAHSYLSQPFCVLWSAVILSRFPEIQVKMEKPYFGYHLICYLWSFTSEGTFYGEWLWENFQFLFFRSSCGKLGKNDSLDSHQWLSTIRARCGRLLVNTVFSREGGGVWGKLVRKQGFIVLPAVLFTPSIRKIDSMNSGVGADWAYVAAQKQFGSWGDELLLPGWPDPGRWDWFGSHGLKSPDKDQHFSQENLGLIHKVKKILMGHNEQLCWIAVLTRHGHLVNTRWKLTLSIVCGGQSYTM